MTAVAQARARCRDLEAALLEYFRGGEYARDAVAGFVVMRPPTLSLGVPVAPALYLSLLDVPGPPVAWTVSLSLAQRFETYQEAESVLDETWGRVITVAAAGARARVDALAAAHDTLREFEALAPASARAAWSPRDVDEDAHAATDDENLVERWRRCRGTPADDAAGDALAERLLQRGETLAKVRAALEADAQAAPLDAARPPA